MSVVKGVTKLKTTAYALAVDCRKVTVKLKSPTVTVEVK